MLPPGFGNNTSASATESPAIGNATSLSASAELEHDTQQLQQQEQTPQQSQQQQQPQQGPGEPAAGRPIDPATGVRVWPFEFRVLEACLKVACSDLDGEASRLIREAYPALDELSATVTTLNLQHVRDIKSRLVAVSARVQKVQHSP